MQLEKEYKGIRCRYNSNPRESNVIYQITFPNQKKYIGQTIQPLEVRMKQHCHDAVIEGRQWNVLKCRAMRKYKFFEVSVIDKCGSVDELNRRESEIIDEYLDKGEELYNVASGGLNNCEYFGKSCVVTDLDFNKIKEFAKVKEAREWVGVSGALSEPGTYAIAGGKYYIMKVECYETHSIEDHKKILENMRVDSLIKRESRKKDLTKEHASTVHFNVVQIDHRREKVGRMDIKDTEQKFGRLVRYVLGEDSHHRAYGFYWLTEEQYNRHMNDLAKVLNGLEYIYKIDKDGNVIGEWPSIAIAAKSEGLGETTVSMNARGITRLSEPYFYIRSTDFEKLKIDMNYIRGRVNGRQNINTPVQVLEFDTTGELIARYDSKKSCARSIGATPQRISQAFACRFSVISNLFLIACTLRHLPLASQSRQTLPFQM